MNDLQNLLKKIPKCIHQAEDDFRKLKSINIQTKYDNSKATALDYLIQERMEVLLQKEFPRHRVWGEETFEEHIKNNNIDICQGDHWVIDPIDGTTNLINNIPAYCTTVSLISNGLPQIAITYDPNRHEIFTAQKDKGFYFNDLKISSSKWHKEINECVAAIDLKRLSNNLRQTIVDQQPFYSQRNFGSSGLEWCWLAINRFQVYLHGSQQIWDYASGFLCIEELGGIATTLHGNSLKPLKLQKQSVLASLSPKIHDFWLDFINKAETVSK